MFGGLLAIAVLIAAALVLGPRQIHVDAFAQIPFVSRRRSVESGFILFLATLCVTCFGATVEIALSMAYMLAQGFGWHWGENLRPAKDTSFSFAYSVVIFLAAIPIALGV